jgi:hypothetical protein
MNDLRMFELARDLAAAKSRQDVPAALRLLHPTMLLESPAFGTSTATPATATPWSAGAQRG